MLPSFDELPQRMSQTGELCRRQHLSVVDILAMGSTLKDSSCHLRCVRAIGKSGP